MLKSIQIREKGGPAADEKEEWLNLVTEAENAAEKYRPFAEILGVRIQVTASEERIIVKAAKNNIRKIFGNIIENSLKYMHSEGVIVITLSHIENQTLIVIKDNGRGCGKEKTEKISDKFQGLTFVLTGTLETMGRSEASEIIQSLGGKASGSVSKKTSYVIAGANAGSKLTKAESLGIKIITEQEFLAMVKEN